MLLPIKTKTKSAKFTRQISNQPQLIPYYTLFSTKLAGPFTLHIYPPTLVIASVRHAHRTRVQIMRTVARRTFTLTRTGLPLRVDKYEPHNCRQFSTEQSIVPDV